jgi:hypothetical protein
MTLKRTKKGSKCILMKDLIEMANFLLVDPSGFNIRKLIKSVMAVSPTESDKWI